MSSLQEAEVKRLLSALALITISGYTHPAMEDIHKDIIRLCQEWDTKSKKIEQLRGALKGILDRYIGLVESGDCGNWDVQSEARVVEAQALLEEE